MTTRWSACCKYFHVPSNILDKFLPLNGILLLIATNFYSQEICFLPLIFSNSNLVIKKLLLYKYVSYLPLILPILCIVWSHAIKSNIDFWAVPKFIHSVIICYVLTCLKFLQIQRRFVLTGWVIFFNFWICIST